MLVQIDCHTENSTSYGIVLLVQEIVIPIVLLAQVIVSPIVLLVQSDCLTESHANSQIVLPIHFSYVDYLKTIPAVAEQNISSLS